MPISKGFLAVVKRLWYNSNMDFTKEMYKNFNIYELRVYAMKIGVKSPTTKTKETLVSEIEKIKNGELSPYIKPNNRGRPSKNSLTFPSIEGCLDAEIIIKANKKRIIDEVRAEEAQKIAAALNLIYTATKTLASDLGITLKDD